MTIPLQVVCASLTVFTFGNRTIPKFAKSNSEMHVCCLSKFYGQAKGLISTGQLSTLLHLHFQPINVVVYHESHWQN